MFGLSFSELIVIGVVALVAVGPQKLPGMLRTLGEWIRKARNLTNEVRAQTGIDEILRAEGLHGGLTEFKSLVRGLNRSVYEPLHTPPSPIQPPAPLAGLEPEPPASPTRHEDPYANLEVDATREYPPEGPDAYGALPDDLFDNEEPLPPGLDVLSAARAVPERAPESPLPGPADADPGPSQQEAPVPPTNP